MHNTVVKGLMAQITEAGQMTPELETLFNEKILVTTAKRGRKTTKPTGSSSDSDSSSSTKKPKRKYTRKTTGPNPHKALVSKCISYVYRSCEYDKNPCNIDVLSVKRTNYQIVMGTCEFMATAMEKRAMKAVDAMIEGMRLSNEKWGVEVFDLEDAGKRQKTVDISLIPVLEIITSEPPKETPKETPKKTPKETPKEKKTPMKKKEVVVEKEEETEEEVEETEEEVEETEETEEVEEEEETDDEEEEEEEEDMVAVCLNN